MKEKLLELWKKAYEKSPLACGLSIGYFGKPILDWAIEGLRWLMGL